MRSLLICLSISILDACLASGQNAPTVTAAGTTDLSSTPVGALADAASSGPSALAPAASPDRVWGEVDYLMWFIKPVCLKPTILTTGSPTDPVPGALGQANTTNLLGPHKFEFGPLSGVRPTIGIWLDSQQNFGFESSGFILQQGSVKIAFASNNGSPSTYIPYQDPQNSQQALPFTTPGLVNGLAMAVGNSFLWGTEFNFTGGFSATHNALTLRADMLFGARYLDLRDKVNLYDQQSLAADALSNAFGAAEFTTHNQFYGGQVGFRFGLEYGRWTASYQSKIALGETHEVSQITGSSLLSAQGNAGGLLPGPVLAQSSNTGRQSNTALSVVSEASFKLRYRVTDWLGLSLGYSAIYWNRVLCPGDQMDSHLNPTELPGRGPVTGPPGPTMQFVHTDFFAQGYNIGVDLRY